MDGLKSLSYGERLKYLKLFSVKGRLLRANIIRVGWGKLPRSFSQFPLGDAGGNLKN